MYDPEHGIYLDPETTAAVDAAIDAMENAIVRAEEKRTGEHLGNFERGQLLNEKLPDWAARVRSALHQQRHGHGESTSAGYLPPRELELFAQLRRAILTAGAGTDEVLAAVRKLVTWVPECTPDAVLDEQEDGRHPDLPLFCEAFLYPVLGKHDARTLLALGSKVARTLGFSSLRDLQEKG